MHEVPGGLSTEQSALLEIESYYRAFHELYEAERPLRVLPASSFGDDLKLMRHPTPPYWCNVHLAAARDHMQVLRRLTGQPPGGLAEWPSHSAWTLTRVVIEAAAYAIWIASPDSQKERFARAFQMWNRDAIDEITAIELTYSARKRQRLGLSLRQAHSARLTEKLELLPWAMSREQIVNGPAAVECIKVAARESRCAKPDSAVILWRVASGHAHARSWAHLNSAEFESLEETETGTLVRGTVNVLTICPSIALALGLLQYADWLVAKRSGYSTRFEASIDLTVK